MGLHLGVCEGLRVWCVGGWMVSKFVWGCGDRNRRQIVGKGVGKSSLPDYAY